MIANANTPELALSNPYSMIHKKGVGAVLMPTLEP